jgi:hypothetical protein
MPGTTKNGSKVEACVKNFPESGAWCAQLCGLRDGVMRNHGGERPREPDGKVLW